MSDTLHKGIMGRIKTLFLWILKSAQVTNKQKITTEYPFFWAEGWFHVDVNVRCSVCDLDWPVICVLQSPADFRLPLSRQPSASSRPVSPVPNLGCATKGLSSVLLNSSSWISDLNFGIIDSCLGNEWYSGFLINILDFHRIFLCKLAKIEQD